LHRQRGRRLCVSRGAREVLSIGVAWGVAVASAGRFGLTPAGLAALPRGFGVEMGACGAARACRLSPRIGFSKVFATELMAR